MIWIGKDDGGVVVAAWIQPGDWFPPYRLAVRMWCGARVDADWAAWLSLGRKMLQRRLGGRRVTTI